MATPDPTPVPLNGIKCEGTLPDAPYQPVVETEDINNKDDENKVTYCAITSQPEYNKWSFEELRTADYANGRRLVQPALQASQSQQVATSLPPTTQSDDSKLNIVGPMAQSVEFPNTAPPLEMSDDKVAGLTHTSNHPKVERGRLLSQALETIAGNSTQAGDSVSGPSTEQTLSSDAQQSFASSGGLPGSFGQQDLSQNIGSATSMAQPTALTNEQPANVSSTGQNNSANAQTAVNPHGNFATLHSSRPIRPTFGESQVSGNQAAFALGNPSAPNIRNAASSTLNAQNVLANSGSTSGTTRRSELVLTGGSVQHQQVAANATSASRSIRRYELVLASGSVRLQQVQQGAANTGSNSRLASQYEFVLTVELAQHLQQQFAANIGSTSGPAGQWEFVLTVELAQHIQQLVTANTRGTLGPAGHYEFFLTVELAQRIQQLVTANTGGTSGFFQPGRPAQHIQRQVAANTGGTLGFVLSGDPAQSGQQVPIPNNGPGTFEPNAQQAIIQFNNNQVVAQLPLLK